MYGDCEEYTTTQLVDYINLAYTGMIYCLSSIMNAISTYLLPMEDYRTGSYIPGENPSLIARHVTSHPYKKRSGDF